MVSHTFMLEILSLCFHKGALLTRRHSVMAQPTHISTSFHQGPLTSNILTPLKSGHLNMVPKGSIYGRFNCSASLWCCNAPLSSQPFQQTSLGLDSPNKVPTFMTSVQFLMSMGNWSVSQPRSGEPVLESIEPRKPNLFVAMENKQLIYEGDKH